MTIVSLYRIDSGIFGGYIEPAYAGDTVHHIIIDLKDLKDEITTAIQGLLYPSREMAFKAAFTQAFGEDEYNDNYR